MAQLGPDLWDAAVAAGQFEAGAEGAGRLGRSLELARVGLGIRELKVLRTGRL